LLGHNLALLAGRGSGAHAGIYLNLPARHEKMPLEIINVCVYRYYEYI